MKKDLTPWLLLPGIVLTLSSATLLVPHQTASASAPVPAPKLQAVPKADTYDDGDGDELLEHWGDPRYSREERRQMAGMAGGFLVLGALAYRRRTRTNHRCEIVSLPGDTESYPQETRKAA